MASGTLSKKQDKWTYKGYTTGTSTKDFSNESFNEIKFVVHITHDGANYEFSGSLTRDDILNGTNNIFIIGGYYLSATNNCAVGVNVPSTMLFGLRWIFFNSSSESANATVRYYTK